jgi:hypothetical protein
MEHGFWLVIIFVLLYEPVCGYREFQKLKMEVKVNDKARLKFYKSSIIDKQSKKNGRMSVFMKYCL